MNFLPTTVRIFICVVLFILLNAAFIAVAACCALLKCAAPDFSRRAVFASLRLTARIICFAASRFGGFSLEFSGTQNIPAEPAVFVFNHISILDPLFVLAVVPNAAVVVKKKYEFVPAIWIMTHFFDFISLGDGGRGDLAAAMAKIDAVVGRGANLVVFPEGTRVAGGRLGDFRVMAYRVARKFGRKVVSGAIVASEEIFPKGSSVFAQKAGFSVKVDVLPAISSDAFKSADAMCTASYRAVGAACVRARRGFPEKS